MRAAGAKKSLSRQIQEENQAVRGGKAPEKRKRVQNTLIQSEVAQQQPPEGDDVQLQDQDEVQEERYLHVDLDAEGAEHVVEEAKKKRRPLETPRKAPAIGESEKIKANVVLDSSGTPMKTADGVVKVNMAKYIMRPVTEEDLEGRLKGMMQDGKKLTTEYYECVLWTSVASSSHKRFKKVGANTGNLMKHCKSHHQPVLDGIVRLIEESSSKDVNDKIKEFVKGAKAPVAKMDRFFNRREDAEINKELLALLFFLDGNIPFTQLDNEYFRQLLWDSNVKLASSQTIVNSLLPGIYRFAMEDMIARIGRCKSFYVSFDGWSRFGCKFISQNYHTICADNFSYNIMMLDLIPYQGPKFAEVVAGLLSQRQEHWTKDMEIVAAGGMADGESKIQKGGKIMYGDEDMGRCQNHALKGVYEEGEKNSPIFAQDLHAISSLATAVHNNGNLLFEISTFQKTNELAELHFLLYNETRWEGRKSLLQRTLDMEAELRSLHDHDLVIQQRNALSDFLEESYFQRLRGYVPLLTEFDNVSKLYQSQAFPTGCFVPLCVQWLLNVTTDDPENPSSRSLRQLKAALHAAVALRMREPIFGTPNTFLKASFFHPGVAKIIISLVSDEVVDGCFASTMEDAKALGVRKQFVQAALDIYRDEFIKVRSEMPARMPWSDLKKDGTFNGFNHLGFWKNVAQDREFHDGDFIHLRHLSAMLLAAPAGESIDEFCFSSSQRTLSTDRNSLSSPKVEQITIIRMFIRNFGFTPRELHKWFNSKKMEHDRQTQARGIEDRFAL